MFSQKFHRIVFLIGLCGLACCMMLGSVPTSVPQIVLLANWLVEMQFGRKWQMLKTNKLFWVLISAFLFHVIGMLYTQDLSAGIADLKIKMPIFFFLLVIFSTRPLSQKEFHGVLYCFLAGAFINTVWCLLYSFVLHSNEVGRNTSRFMSHIRLGLFLNMAIATAVYFAFKSEQFLKRAGLILLSIYFVFVLYVLGLASGITNFIILFFAALIVVIYRQKLRVKLSAFAVLIVLIVVCFRYVSTIAEQQLSIKPTAVNERQGMTVLGNLYIHFTEDTQKENGNFIQMNIQPEEIQKQWKKEFPEDSFSFSPKHNLQRYEVLVRYMSSKGLMKDSVGMAQLTNDDKIAIRKNVVNYQYSDWSYLHRRTYELVNEYDEFKNNRHINGHSLTMRAYFWKAAMKVISATILFGVGTGDVQDELNKAYKETNSPLKEEWYKRPHNQLLTITVALGLVGLVIFLISIVYPVLILRKHLHILYWPFFIMLLLSFLVEDTLETQAGLTYYIFFNGLFMWWAFSTQSSQRLRDKE